MFLNCLIVNLPHCFDNIALNVALSSVSIAVVFSLVPDLVSAFICISRMMRLVVLVHSQVAIIFVVSVGLFVCAEFFSAVFNLILIKLGHMLYIWV